MPDLKLPRLPDRTSVKHTIVVMPSLEQKLRDYAALYRQTYGESETIETLVPFMLEAFIETDKEFSRMNKARCSPSQPIRGKLPQNRTSPAGARGPITESE